MLSVKNKTTLKLSLWLFLVFLVPAVVGVCLSYYVYEEQAHKEQVVQSVKETVSGLTQCLAEPMAYFAPQEVVRVGQMIALNPSIVEIFAYSDLYEMVLVHLDMPERRRGELISHEEIVYFQGAPVGRVRLTASTELIAKKGWFLLVRRIIFTFLGMFIAGFLLFDFLFQKKIVRPIRRLLTQARKIDDGVLTEPCIWTGDDEFANLGKTIEKMRKSLLFKFQKMHDEARTDSLTGISNRRDFMEKITDNLAYCYKQERPFSLIMFDLDDFKQVNDTYGHAVGDDVLNITPRILQKNIRNDDLLARWGGEEFLIALPGTPLQQACLLAEKLRQLIANTSYPMDIRMTASFGVVEAGKGESFATLLEQVDEVMYTAKQQGKNRVVKYEEKNGKK